MFSVFSILILIIYILLQCGNRKSSIYQSKEGLCMEDTIFNDSGIIGVDAD